MQVHVWSLRALISINSFCQPAITPGLGLVTHPSVDEDDTRSHTGARIYRAEESLFNNKPKCWVRGSHWMRQREAFERTRCWLNSRSDEWLTPPESGQKIQSTILSMEVANVTKTSLKNDQAIFLSTKQRDICAVVAASSSVCDSQSVRGAWARLRLWHFSQMFTLASDCKLKRLPLAAQ